MQGTPIKVGLTESELNFFREGIEREKKNPNFSEINFHREFKEQFRDIKSTQFFEIFGKIKNLCQRRN